jgi:hypothetical protein
MFQVTLLNHVVFFQTFGCNLWLEVKFLQIDSYLKGGLTMAPPTPVPCGSRGCSFTTPLGAEMKAMLEFLKIHVQTAHPLMVATEQAPPRHQGSY